MRLRRKPSGKTPKAKYRPRVRKRPTVAVDPDAQRDRALAWRFARVDLAGSWWWGELASEHVAELQQQLADLETQTVHALTNSDELKPIAVTDIAREAQQRLRDIEQEDVDELWELRLRDRRRVWGIVQGSFFYLLWWDPSHTVCTGKDRARTRNR